MKKFHSLFVDAKKTRSWHNTFSKAKRRIIIETMFHFRFNTLFNQKF